MIVARYFNLFILFSIIGWVYECTFCTIQAHHWQKRGFLYGPLCPIYGVGAVGAMVIFSILPPLPDSFGADYPIWEIFLICAAGSAVLEFVTSWVLEKLFHAVWWDYSNVPFNIQGRICLPASCGFGAVGVVIVKFVLPHVQTISLEEKPFLNEVVSLVFAFLLGMDLALTVESLSKLTQRMDEAEMNFNAKMENSVQAVTSTLNRRDRYHLRSIRGYRPRKRNTPDTAEKLRNFFTELQKKVEKPEDKTAEK